LLFKLQREQSAYSPLDDLKTGTLRDNAGKLRPHVDPAHTVSVRIGKLRRTYNLLTVTAKGGFHGTTNRST
jgi:hypothetical protein